MNEVRTFLLFDTTSQFEIYIWTFYTVVDVLLNFVFSFLGLDVFLASVAQVSQVRLRVQPTCLPGVASGPAHLASTAVFWDSLTRGSRTDPSLERLPSVHLIPIAFSSVVLSRNSKPEVDFGTSSFLTSHNICSRLMKKWMIINIITLKAWGYFGALGRKMGLEEKPLTAKVFRCFSLLELTNPPNKWHFSCPFRFGTN